MPINPGSWSRILRLVDQSGLDAPADWRPTMGAIKPHVTPDMRSGFETVVRDPCHVRHFVAETVDRADVEHMVDLAMCAASVCTTQTWRFIAVSDPALLGRMCDAVLSRFEQLALTPGLALQKRRLTAARAQALSFAKAPLCMAVLADPSNSPVEELMELAGMTEDERERQCVRPELQSAGAAVQLLATSANSLGYATCWTCAPMVAGERIEELLAVQAPTRLVALVAVGRSAQQPTASRRMPLEEALTFR
jgi:nitroreductase